MKKIALLVLLGVMTPLHAQVDECDSGKKIVVAKEGYQHLVDSAIKSLSETPCRLLMEAGRLVAPPKQQQQMRVPIKEIRHEYPPKSHEECLAENKGQENVVYHRCRGGYVITERIYE